jgi:glycosyltransferase involved in cell wall biosynthesis
MKARGHTVYHYGHPASEVDCTEHINVTNDFTLENSYGDLNNWKEKGFNQNVEEGAVKVFNESSIREINKRLSPNNKDFILCWFGYAQEPCARAFYKKAFVVEPSIGYDSMFAPVRIFETYAQMHKMHGAAQDIVKTGYEFVVNPGFDSSDFSFKSKKTDTALFLGRIIEAKGAKFAYDICNERKQKINFAGPNIMQLPETEYCKFLGFIGPDERKQILANAKFLFAPSLFIEPCNWAVIEAQFSGTPTITTDFGGFTETVSHGETGFRCSTRKDFYEAIDVINRISPNRCRNRALDNYTIQMQTSKYERIFQGLFDTKL